MDKKYIFSALTYALTGMVLGTVMAATKNHSQMVTHAHIMLLGFVTTFCYGLCYKLWIKNVNHRIANLQFAIHHTGTFMMLAGLFLIYGQRVDASHIEMMMASSAFAVIVAMLLMILQLIRIPKTQK